MSEPSLKTDFPTHEREDWRVLAEKGLRGASFDTLISTTEDGLARGPLFDAASRPSEHAPLARTDAPKLHGRTWHVCAPVTDSDLGFANTQLLADLSGGASAVRIASTGISRRADLKRVLEGVHLDLVPVIFAPGCNAAEFALSLDDLTDTYVTLGLDPLSERPDCPAHWRPFTANPAAIHEAGGTDALELAGFAATMAEAFRRHGADVNEQLSALFAVGPDAHLGIIKLRAARRIFATIAGAFGIDAPCLPIHAITSHRMMQSQDAWSNMLRTTSAGFGASAGGADYVTIRPFTDTPTDRRLGDATPFGYRVARNQQLLMMEESHIGQVRDVAYGSYFHERLTDDLAQAAWDRFQRIETDGGIEAYLASGALKADCDAAQAERAESNAPILGVTLHPSDDVPAPKVRS